MADQSSGPPDGNWLDKAAKSSAALIWSRLITVIGVPMATMFAMFAWNTLIQVKEFVTANQSDIRLVTQRVMSLEKDASDVKASRYSSSDAVRDFRLRDQIDAEQDRRIERIENSIGGDFPR